MSYGALQCDIVMLQNYMLMICNKRFCNKKGHYLCWTLYLEMNLIREVLNLYSGIYKTFLKEMKENAIK